MEAIPQSPTTPTGPQAGGASTSAPGAPQAAQQQAQARHAMISRKVNKLLDVTIDESLRNALSYVDTMGLRTNDAAAKRQLKPTLEKHLLQLHQQFVTELAAVQRGFEDLSGCVKELTDATAEAQDAVRIAKADAGALASSVALLRAELDEVKEKERHVAKFINEYQLTPEELAVLRADAVTPRFIQVLNRARAIHQQCRDLLSVEHQQAAVEVMESLYLVQMAAHEKLVKHLMTAASEVLAADTLPEINGFFLSAVDALRDRPAQRMKVLHEIARVRRGAVVRRFFDVMTRDAGRKSRALESLLPDVARFFADVLAWLHHCIAEESDIVSCFFAHGSGSSAANEPSGASNGEEDLTGASAASAFIDIRARDILDQIFEGVCKHLQSKFDAAVEIALGGSASDRSSNGGTSSSSSGGGGAKQHPPNFARQLSSLTTLFRVDGILAFYASIVSDLLGENAALSSAIRNTKLSVLKAFYDVLKAVTDAGMAPQHIGDDLATPAETQQLLHVLREMLGVVQTSTMPHAQREAEIGPVLGAIVDPIPRLTRTVELPTALLVSVSRRRIDSASTDTVGGPVDDEVLATATDPSFVALVRRVLRINILSSVLQVLLQYVFTEKKRIKLLADLDAEVDAYVVDAVAILLKRHGFEAKLATIRGGGELEREPTKDVLQAFYSYVYSAGTLAVPLLPCIQSVPLRNDLGSRVVMQICTDYEVLYRYVVDKMYAGDVEAAKETVFHTPQQMKVLLDVQ